DVVTRGHGDAARNDRRSEVRSQTTDDRRRKVVERNLVFMVFLLAPGSWLLTTVNFRHVSY
ncbi:MAG: hypothetical protein LJE87_04950, partial [Deltaproteobacteria bacterium]|nr:hypothetical protein [Deltaproteobacteria bacterium]